MTRNVIDENVLIVANGRANHADDDCYERAIDVLLHCRDSMALVLDEDYEILKKYAGHCSYSGQPGVGSQFFVWAHETAPQLTRVLLLKTAAEEYVDFPDDPDLNGFDADDRVWVAATVAAGPEAILINAVDSDYLHHRVALEANGISVHELCENLLKSV